VKHPWLPEVEDTPCMYDRKGEDDRCVGCWRRGSRMPLTPVEFKVTPDLLRVQESWGRRNEVARALLEE